MKEKRFTSAEIKVMSAFWDLGPSAIREVLETYPETRRPAYTTVQTLVYRLEEKGAIRRTRKIGGAHIFEAVISREQTQRRLLDELLELVGGRVQPLMSNLIDTGKLTVEDLEAAKKALRESRHGKSGRRPKE